MTKENKTLKGITKASTNKQITFENYKTALFDNVINFFYNFIVSLNKHNIYLREEYKSALDPFDDKRMIFTF